MIPTGISPTEAAFEVVGLVNAKSIIDFLFFETKIGLAIFLIGMLTALWRSVKETDFSVLWSYLIMFCVLLFIFIGPMASLEDATSTMEAAGWKGTTTQEALKDAFIDSGKARASSLGLVLISQGYNGIVYGTISTITKVTQQKDFNYLNNPFIVNKVSLYLQHFSSDGIKKDNALRKDLEEFLKNDYPQTLGRMVNNGKTQANITKKWWPGDEEVITNYDVDQRKRWEALDLRLTNYIKTEIGKLSAKGPFTDLFIDYKAIKIKLLAGHTEKAATDIVSNMTGYGIEPKTVSLSWMMRQPASWLVYASSFVGQFFSTTLAEFMIKALPYLQGYAVMIIYSLFPFTLLLCLLLGTFSILKEYFIYLFWVKSWVIVWALIHYAAIYMSTLQARLGSGTSSWFFEKPYFNTVTGVLLVMSPGIAWFMTKGVLSGIGEAATALTLHADKGTGKIGAIFILSFLISGQNFARSGFFEEKDTPIQESGCSECKNEVTNLNADLKKKALEIEKTISNKFNKEENLRDNEITLFIDLDCGFSDAAVNALVMFKKDNPGWKAKGVIVTNGKSLKEKLLQKQSYFTNDIEFSIDLSGNLAKQFGIQKTPTYVITYNSRYYKITGQPDLNEIISKLNK